MTFVPFSTIFGTHSVAADYIIFDILCYRAFIYLTFTSQKDLPGNTNMLGFDILYKRYL